MTDPKLEIIWRKDNAEHQHPDYVSTDGRWRIIHNKRSESKRWELYDLRETCWEGDWLSLSAAKDKARRLARQTAAPAGGSGHNNGDQP